MRWNESGALWVLALLALAASPYLLLAMFDQPAADQPPPIALNELTQQVEDGRIASIRMADDRGIAVDVNGYQYAFQLGQGIDALEVLSAFGATPMSLARSPT